MFVVNKNMTIGEVIRQDPDTAALLNQYGMHCTSCPFSRWNLWSRPVRSTAAMWTLW